MKEAIAILTGGGPAPGMNTVVGSVAKTFLAKGYRVIGLHYGYSGLFNPNPRFEDMDFVKSDFIFNQGGSYLTMSRFKPTDKDFEENFNLSFFQDNNIKLLVTVGGDDTASTANRIAKFLEAKQYPIANIHVPKTIDNDLALTDHTPGFGSAAKYIGTSMKEIIRDGFCLEYPKGLVTIVEIMGRNAGWLTGAAALSKGEDCEGPDLIYLPELTFDINNFKSRVEKLLKKKTSVVIAVSEGIRTADGNYVCELGKDINFVDSFGHKQLSGTASYLAHYIAAELGAKTRAIELSTLQRAGSHLASRVDILEAYQVGGAAVKAADEGDSGMMVTLERTSEDPYQAQTAVKNVHKIANVEKKVPREWITEDGTYVTPEFVNYIRPLIQAELTAIMVDGLPRHLYYREDR